MNSTIFKMTLKRNWKLLLIFFSVLCFYLGTIISLIDPDNMKEVQELYASMGEMMAAFGISVDAMTSPLSYTASAFFGILVMAFTMVFYVIQANKLIGKSVDDSSLSYTLSTPVSRTSLIVTQAVYLIFSISVLFAGVFATGVIFLNTMGSYDSGAYANLVSVTFLLCTGMAMLSFFFSVAFCDSKKGAGLSTGVPIAFLVLNMLGSAGGKSTEWLVKINPFGWIDSVGIVNGTVSTWWMYAVFTGVIALLFIASILVFNRKRLPL